ncbi:MAG: DUF4114 domain-containing protein [Rhodobiaceae bacterium]|nr:DUF4114 domain-containing protein [Rhodobiaceae bacterium]
MASLPATHPLIGTSNDDTISGTRHSDVMSGGRGNDVMTGETGHDEVWGGQGDDVLYGNSGNDFLYGSGGPNIVQVTAIPIANDYPVSVIFEGETAGYRNSFGYYKIDSETGAIYDVDVIWENASLQGSGGSLIGGETTVPLDVAPGDQLGFFIVSNGYSYNNYDALGEGSYSFTNADGSAASLTSSNPKLVHTSDDGTVTEIRHHQYHTAAFGDTLGLNPDGILHTTGILKTDAGTLTLGFEDLYNGGDRDFDDSVFTVDIGTANAQVLNAHYRSEQGLPDIVYDGDGNTPNAEPVQDNDILYGGTGSDELWGHKGNDQLYGGTGNDELHGGSGDDTLHGGSNNDVLYGNLGNDFVYGDNGDDHLYGNSGDDYLNGGGNNDRIEGSAGNDTLLGEHGNDILSGGSGDDVLDGGNGADELSGGSGADSLAGGAGSDELSGNSGSDILDGGSGNDELLGGSGDDTLFGGSGNDILYGHSGDDILDGGTGSDQIHGGSGIDTVDYQSWSKGIRANLAEGTVIGNGTDTLTGIENLIGSSHNDKIIGSNKANTLSGGDGNDYIAGHAGDDTVYGGTGNDYLNGASGADTLYAGQGDDRLRGGKGSDKLNGGAGDDEMWGAELGRQDNASDTFYFDIGDGYDIIRDFDIGIDILALSDTLYLDDVDFMSAFTDTDDGAFLSFASFNGVEGDGVLFTDLTADAFQTVAIDDTSSLDWAFLA